MSDIQWFLVSAIEAAEFSWRHLIRFLKYTVKVADVGIAHLIYNFLYAEAGIDEQVGGFFQAQFLHQRRESIACAGFDVAAQITLAETEMFGSFA